MGSTIVYGARAAYCCYCHKSPSACRCPELEILGFTPVFLPTDADEAVVLKFTPKRTIELVEETRACVWCDAPLPHTCGPYLIDNQPRTVTNNEINPPPHSDPFMRSLLITARAGVVTYEDHSYALTWVEGD